MKKVIHLSLLFAFFGCLPATGYSQDPGFGLHADIDHGIVEAVKSNIESTLGQQWQFVSSAEKDTGVIYLYFETRLGSRKRVLSLELLFLQSPADAQMAFKAFQHKPSRPPAYSELEGVGEEALRWHADPDTRVMSRQNSVFIFASLQEGGDEEIIEFTRAVAQAIASVK